MELTIRLRQPHEQQKRFIDSAAKRKIIRAGRRGGKTVGVSILAVRAFLAGNRVLYATPTQEQIDRFWEECKRALKEPLEHGIFYKNETRHIIELAGTQQRIRAKTAWDADTLRGDYADLLILDEWQLMKENAWGLVGAPMLLDNNGDAVFIYTPPSLESRTRSRARDPLHAAKMFRLAAQDRTGRWEAFSFPSYENPHISTEALAEVSGDLTSIAYRQEILAEDIEDAPGALWTRETIEKYRVTSYPELYMIGVGVDPHGSVGETGIVAGGVAKVDGLIHGYILEDATKGGAPAEWATQVVATHNKYRANFVVAEKNEGGDMVLHTLRSVPGSNDVVYRTVWASRSKQARAQPVSALYEQGRVHHVGVFQKLEDEYCTWEPGLGMESPNRLDAAVWLLTIMMIKGGEAWGF